MDFSILRRQQRVKLRIYPGPLVELVKKKVGCPSIWVATIGTFKSRYLGGDSKYHQGKLKPGVARGNAKPRRGAACLDCISFRVRLKERKSNQISTQKKNEISGIFYFANTRPSLSPLHVFFSSADRRQRSADSDQIGIDSS